MDQGMQMRQETDARGETLDQQISQLAAEVDNVASELPDLKEIALEGRQCGNRLGMIVLSLEMARRELERSAELAEGVEL